MESSKPQPPQSFFVQYRRPIIVLALCAIVAVAVAVFMVVKSQTLSGNIVATVNGEPIYAEEIASSLALIPDVYKTPDQRDQVINQTIDMMLLKQEARRRGIVVTERDVAVRIETILNDTGRSPQELRLILAGQNLTRADFDATVSDMITVERVVSVAVQSRITVSEQEIQAYFLANQALFLPPEGGVRVSHILLATEADARTIIAALNRGESFRELAEVQSLDTSTAANGGSLGVVTPDSALDNALRNAALALRENQYTRVPVQSADGYHVVLRNFDLPPIQQVRDDIRATLRSQRERAAFNTLVDGLRAGAQIKLYTADGFVTAPRRVPADLQSFAACVSTSATLYVTSWSEPGQTQLAAFGDAAPFLAIVDCDKQPVACGAVDVATYPTWLIGSDRFGALTLAEIAKETGCALP